LASTNSSKMTLQEQQRTTAEMATGFQPGNRRWFLLAVLSGAFLLMLFYTLTDGAHIDHDPLLTAGDWGGYALCHRITERSFSINGRQFPFCARCTGMYLGAALAIAVFFLAGRTKWVLLPSKWLFFALLGLILLMGIDGLNSYSHFFPNAPHLYEPKNWLRLATGMGAGLTLGTIVFAALAQSLWREPRYSPLIGNFRELAGLVLLGLVAVFLVLTNRPVLLYLLALVSSGGLLFVVTALNTAVLTIFLRKDGQAKRWSDAIGLLLVGMILAILELGAISIMRWNITGTMTGFPGI
jgi:uncharacterized membrane protein